MLFVGGQKTIGKIKYECKETKKFQSKWISDLKKTCVSMAQDLGLL